jgi:hypothetical protein
MMPYGINIDDKNFIETHMNSVWGGYRWRKMNKNIYYSPTYPNASQTNDIWIKPVSDVSTLWRTTALSSCLVDKIAPLYTSQNYSESGYKFLGIIYDYLGVYSEHVKVTEGTSIYTYSVPINYMSPTNIVSLINMRNKKGVSLYEGQDYTVDVRNVVNEDFSVDFVVTITYNEDFTGSFDISFPRYAFEDYCLISNREARDILTSKFSFKTDGGHAAYKITHNENNQPFSVDIEDTDSNVILHSVPYSTISPNEISVECDFKNFNVTLNFDNDFVHYYHMKWYDLADHNLKIWDDYDSLGTWRTAGMCDGTKKYLKWRIPATEFPKYSQNFGLYQFTAGKDDLRKTYEPMSSSVHLATQPLELSQLNGVITYKTYVNFDYTFKDDPSILDNVYLNVPQSVKPDLFTFVKHTGPNDDNVNSNQTSAYRWVIKHMLDSYELKFVVYDQANKPITPSSYSIDDNNTLTLYFTNPQYVGKCVVNALGKFTEVSQTLLKSECYYTDSDSVSLPIKNKTLVQVYDYGNTRLDNVSISESSTSVAVSNINSKCKVVYKQADFAMPIDASTNVYVTMQNIYGSTNLILQLLDSTGNIVPLQSLKVDATVIKFTAPSKGMYTLIGFTASNSQSFLNSKIINIPHSTLSMDAFVQIFDNNGNEVKPVSLNVSDTQISIRLASYTGGKIVYHLENYNDGLGNYVPKGYTINGNKISFNNIPFVMQYDAVNDRTSYPFFYNNYTLYLQYLQQQDLTTSQLNFASFIDSQNYLGFKADFYIIDWYQNKAYDYLLRTINSYIDENYTQAFRNYTALSNSIGTSLQNAITPIYKDGVIQSLNWTLNNLNTSLRNLTGTGTITQTDVSILTNLITIYRNGVIDLATARSALQNACETIKGRIYAGDLQRILPSVNMATYLYSTLNVEYLIQTDFATFKYAEANLLNSYIDQMNVRMNNASVLCNTLKTMVSSQFMGMDVNAAFSMKLIQQILTYDRYNVSVQQGFYEIYQNFFTAKFASIVTSVLDALSPKSLIQEVDAFNQADLISIGSNFFTNMKNSELESKIDYVLTSDVVCYGFNIEYGSYRVPFNNGGHILVNGVEQVVGKDYFFQDANRGRNVLTFYEASLPKPGDQIAVNLYYMDRIFVSLVNPDDPEHPNNCGNGEKWLNYLIYSYEDGWDNLQWDVVQWDGLGFDINNSFVFTPKVIGQPDDQFMLDGIGSVNYVRTNKGNYFEFQFLKIPDAGAIVKIRCEQRELYNGYTRVVVDETMKFNDHLSFEDSINTSTQESRFFADKSTYIDLPQLSLIETYGRLSNLVDTGNSNYARLLNEQATGFHIYQTLKDSFKVTIKDKINLIEESLRFYDDVAVRVDDLMFIKDAMFFYDSFSAHAVETHGKLKDVLDWSTLLYWDAYRFDTTGWDTIPLEMYKNLDATGFGVNLNINDTVSTTANDLMIQDREVILMKESDQIQVSMIDTLLLKDTNRTLDSVNIATNENFGKTLSQVVAGSSSTLPASGIKTSDGPGESTSTAITDSMVANFITYDTFVVRSSPASYYRLGDASGNIMDYLGVNNGTSVVGTPAYGQPGLIAYDTDTAIGFNGSAFLVPPVFAKTDTGISVECWFSMSTLNTGSLIYTGSPAESELSIGTNAGNYYVAFQVMTMPTSTSTSGGTWIAVEHTTPLQAATTYHVVGTWKNDGTLSVWVNDTQVVANFAPSYIGVNDNISAPYHYFPTIGGSYSSSNGLSTPVNAVIDEVAFYKKALTPFEVASHYHNGLQ